MLNINLNYNALLKCNIWCISSWYYIIPSGKKALLFSTSLFLLLLFILDANRKWDRVREIFFCRIGCCWAGGHKTIFYIRASTVEKKTEFWFFHIILHLIWADSLIGVNFASLSLVFKSSTLNQNSVSSLELLYFFTFQIFIGFW